MSTTFTARLNRVFDTVYPPGRGPHTSAEVIAALRSEGITMSAPYLSQLRSGNRTNPSSATMQALANFFRIKPAYFTDDEYYEKLDQELTWLANMRDEGVRRIAARTVGLSVEAQDRITQDVDEYRRKEGLDSESAARLAGPLGEGPVSLAFTAHSSRRSTHRGTAMYNLRTTFGMHQSAVLRGDRENPFAIGVSVRLV